MSGKHSRVMSGPGGQDRGTVATLAVLAYSFVVTWVIAKVLNVTMGLRIHEADELRGIDITAHSEAAYLSDEEPVELGSPHRG